MELLTGCIALSSTQAEARSLALLVGEKGPKPSGDPPTYQTVRGDPGSPDVKSFSNQTDHSP